MTETECELFLAPYDVKATKATQNLNDLGRRILIAKIFKSIFEIIINLQDICNFIG